MTKYIHKQNGSVLLRELIWEANLGQDRCKMSLDSAVVTAARYGMDSSGSEPRLGQEIFSSPHPSKPILRPTQLQVQWVLDLFSGSKAAGAC
jgi:hypothetical protein